MKKKFSEQHRKNLSKAQTKRWKNKQLRKQQSIINTKTRSKETKEERIKYKPKNPNTYTIQYLKNKYPFFFSIETPRYNPKKRREIQTKCKKCNKWFTPTSAQLACRIYALEKDDGNDGLFLYCSKECKNQCSVYNLKNYKIKDNNSTKQEYYIFRQFVLERDNYICQFCGKPARYVHHERPQKLEPFFALDPDFAWSCCKKCHYEKGHPTGTDCSIGSLTHKIC